MHSALTTWQDDTDPGDQEPVVLSYTQFRNRLGLLEWRRRRAAYLQGAAMPTALGPQCAGAAPTGQAPTRCGAP